jgi:hypothetical protein
LRLCLFQSDGVSLLACSSDLMPSITVSSAGLTGSSVVLRVVGDTDRIANSYTLSLEFP